MFIVHFHLLLLQLSLYYFSTAHRVCSAGRHLVRIELSAPLTSHLGEAMFAKTSTLHQHLALFYSTQIDQV